MTQLTPEELQALIAEKGVQISFRADIDVRAWIEIKMREGYQMKGYIQRLIRDDMERSGIKTTEASRTKNPRPKETPARLPDPSYVPLAELGIAQ